MFCYDGPTSFNVLHTAAKMFFPNLLSQDLEKKTLDLLSDLVNQGLIQIKDASQEPSLSQFITSSKGDQFAEVILVKNNMSEYLRFS